MPGPGRAGMNACSTGANEAMGTHQLKVDGCIKGRQFKDLCPESHILLLFCGDIWVLTINTPCRRNEPYSGKREVWITHQSHIHRFSTHNAVTASSSHQPCYASARRPISRGTHSGPLF